MLSVSGLCAGYGKIRVLHGVDLSVGQGEIVALIGANGAGKTTLVRTVCGLIKPTAGTVFFQDQQIQDLPPHKIVARGVIQCAEGRAILERMSVLENLLMGAYCRRDRLIQSDLDRTLDRFPVLKERRNQPARVLSGGEQQMLAIGRALMARPTMLLLDEPSLGLAPLIVADVLRAIVGLRDEGITIFLVEQNARRALQIADRGYVLERGRVVLEGTGTDLLHDPQVQATYLGVRSKNRRVRAGHTVDDEPPESDSVLPADAGTMRTGRAVGGVDK